MKTACLLTLLSALFLVSCSHVRDNPYDPKNPAFAALILPEKLTAVPLCSTAIKLTWTDQNKREEGYALYRGADSLDFALLVETAANTNAYTDRTCKSFTRYYYKIGVFDKLEDTLVSGAPVSARTFYGNPLQMGETDRLLGPSDLRLTRLNASTRVKLSWKNRDNGACGFAVCRGLSPDSMIYLKSAGPNDTTIADTIDSDTTVYYSICSFDTAGVSIKTVDSITVMIAPNNLGLYLASNRDIRLTWNGNEGTTDSILVERSENQENAFVQHARFGRGTTTFLDTSLVSFSSYWYRVTAFSGPVFSGHSNTESLSVTMVRPAVADSNTILLLRFDEDHGPVLADASGNGHNATLATATIAAGKFGNALSCGNNSAAYVADTLYFPDSTLMVDFWTKPKTYLTTGADTMVMVEAKNGPFSIFYANGSLHFQLHATNDSLFSIATPKDMLPNKWYHIAVTYADNYCGIYIDGIMFNRTYHSLKFHMVSDTVYLGQAYASTHCFFAGYIDEVRVQTEPDIYFRK
ncbi:MAG: hypothetical protein A2268_13915 [Candidatus Raymondbacteria bacterium RifOxyA12_full_50_37]|uniref:Fibronectin type-III domain-containing protein n=1 Tax=Candidatus Raymondbacteria bacterium RIFOXYD12_FULL_49_13 TaxID=1817890 RepID=A0A1F7FKV3_UNCRA|nr:MAG: hypothetical protein A2268_13915 [Candidatus Raymondbacteria bacterium RifOxyA12_full_50_37]OGJ88175.1 MAG: hypothetical protein A2248_19255 [Candidatus Raymondbacteria bacterium RIFOXYA2_FULL_49_16]OGJ98132.1 MAG: hypothetical protein A2350_00205 [Candidatus Raymondbacteria bacterium RifOxyB12_full_50_8]OGJ98413.1 MAG: hypothetical protein A2487_02725 [Candidatus Raymondbacteria bacterium RifOxyC12_full_50_8]OGK07221.1 MAG: hypothetical protein A2519_13920 [Candidatus Raymondbacteria b